MKLNINLPKIEKIISLSDLHIRLVKRKDEYEETLETLYNDLRKIDLKNAIIIFLGDAAHSKVEASPESILLLSSFLKSLSNIAPTLVIAGNHDANLANSSRLDILTPIVQNLNHPNLHYLRDSGVYECADIDFYVWSIFGDKEDWPSPKEYNINTKVCLIHAPIHNAITDVGYTITNRHVTIESFDGFDMVIAGDIHSHQILQQYDPTNKKPIIMYNGSILQQSHGESIRGHGWCDWNVKKRSFTFNELKNNWGYYTLKIENGKVPTWDDMPENVRLRIFAGNMDQADIKKLVASIRNKKVVKELAISNFEGARRTGATVQVGTLLDILDVNVQNKLILEYLKSAMTQLSPEVLDRVIDINKAANDAISSEDIARKIVWIPKTLKFNNLFSYGEDNEINFEALRGVVGVFAPNAYGKTSIAEALCFALYDKTPRTAQAANIMNTSKTECYVELKFEIEGVEFTIERRGKKDKKGKVKIDVDFYKTVNGKKVSLNGEQRIYTNANIRSYVGDYEDFILTIFSSSSSQGLFVDRGQADRKDLLSQFMGLTICDRLHAHANDEIKEVAGALKRFRNDDFTQTLVDVQRDIEAAEEEKKKQEIVLEDVNEILNHHTLQIQELYAQKTPVSVSGNLVELNTRKTEIELELDTKKVQLSTFKHQKSNLEDKLEQGKVKLEKDYSTVESDYANYQTVVTKLAELKKQMGWIMTSKGSVQLRLEKASNHEYDPTCKFCLSNGHVMIEAKADAETELKSLDSEFEKMTAVKALYEADIERMGNVQEKYDKLQAGHRWIDKTQLELINLVNLIAKSETDISKFEHAWEKVKKEIEDYYKLIETIEKNTEIDGEIKDHEASKTTFKAQFNQWTAIINQLTSKLAVLGQKKADMLQKIKEASELEDRYEAYEAYLVAVGRDGLPYKIITDILPGLEAEVNQLLNQMVSFSLKFDADGKNVNMKIVYDDENKVWPLEMASGMEKFITGVAIRVALTRISSLPKSNLLIIDEGFSTLDADNRANMAAFFQVMGTFFDVVMIISHLDEARDWVESTLEIHKINGFSNISVK